MSSPSSSIKQNPTLLVVHEEIAARAKLREVFEDCGYRALMVSDAPSAWRTLHREQCDLVVVDLEIPGVDGLALCRLLRTQQATRKLPVIALSDSRVETRKEEAFAAGVNDFITKPSSPGELVTRVASQLLAAQREWELIGSNRELRFLADLGRGLLRALEPEQLVRRLAGSTYEGTDAVMSAAFLRLSEDSQTGCVFDREGSAEGTSLIELDHLQAWLTAATTTPLLLTEPDNFFLRDEAHRIEYAAPLRFSGRNKGALIVAFDRREDCGETECRLIDAAAQQAALAAHVSSLYQAARESSTTLAKEVDRRTAEAESQRRFTEAIIDSLPVSLYAIDKDFRVVAWNRNRELGELGIPRGSALGKNIFNVLSLQKRDVLEQEFARVFESGEIERIEQETVKTNGETNHWLISKIPMRIDSTGEVSHIITVGEDITARVEANRAVARAEKLAAIGRLAAGVVHEINNPLATISACAEALESRLQEGAFSDGKSSALDDLREYLGLIRSEAFRCKSITNGLLDFSRSRTGEYILVNLADVINSAARLLAHQQRDGRIEFKIDTSGDLPPVSGDAGQLQQAIIALATNAIDAMPEGGTLTIAARRQDQEVLVEISDTGVGIAPEHVTKIFEPFFTTKEVGRGTGLGLAVCYGILTEHGGSLDAQSALGVGSTFTITLPVVSEVGEAKT
ncbi:MAG TPA: ATP-binding protein, partial [Pyrinomonadaceae bacterium]|nr:ATP-binding protein [Pyrinomonadaceae bacterium]